MEAKQKVLRRIWRRLKRMHPNMPHKDLTIVAEMCLQDAPQKDGLCSYFRLHGIPPRVPGIMHDTRGQLGGCDEGSRRELLRLGQFLVRAADVDSRLRRALHAQLRKHGADIPLRVGDPVVPYDYTVDRGTWLEKPTTTQQSSIAR